MLSPKEFQRLLHLGRGPPPQTPVGRTRAEQILSYFEDAGPGTNAIFLDRDDYRALAEHVDVAVGAPPYGAQVLSYYTRHGIITFRTN